MTEASESSSKLWTVLAVLAILAGGGQIAYGLFFANPWGVGWFGLGMTVWLLLGGVAGLVLCWLGFWYLLRTPAETTPLNLDDPTLRKRMREEQRRQLENRIAALEAGDERLVAVMTLTDQTRAEYTAETAGRVRQFLKAAVTPQDEADAAALNQRLESLIGEKAL